MNRLLLLIFVVLPIIEIWLLIRVGSWVGAPLTILAVLGTAIIGVIWLRIQGFSTLNRFNQRLSRGELPTRELVEGVLLIVAGAFLLTPGFATDTVGFLLLTPHVRSIFAQWAIKHIFVSQFSASSTTYYGAGGRDADSDEPDPVVIEGEFERVPDKNNNSD